MAIKVGADLGVNPDILLGQWGLETGWGRSVVPGTNNLGNIKDLSGGGVRAVDNMTGSNDAYRAYGTPEAFGSDFTGLIGRRYPGAVGAGADAMKYATALKQGGYAEDPDYVRKLTGAAATARRAMGIRSDSEPNSGMVAMYQQGNMRPASMTSNNDEWAALAKQYSQAEKPKEQGGDEWAALAQQFSQQAPAEPVAAPVQPAAAPKQQQPVAPQRTTGQELARQVGLSLRAPVQAGAELLGMLGDPLNATANLFGANLPPLSQTLTRGIDAVFPTPETDREKFSNRVAAGGYSAALPTGLAGKAKPVTDMGKAVATGMTKNAGSQVLGGSSAAGASELAAQSDWGVPGQVAAGVVGGMVGGSAGAAAEKVGRAAGRAAAKAKDVATRPAAAPVGYVAPQSAAPVTANTLVDQGLTKTLLGEGVDFAKLDADVKSALRKAATDAATAGQTVDPASLVRLARFKSLGVSPTSAMVSRDPYAWAQEKRLSKLEGGIGQPLVERYSSVDDALGNELAALGGKGAKPASLLSGSDAGDAVTSAVRNAWDSTGKQVDSLYDAYRAGNPYAAVPGQQVADAYGNIAREYGKGQIPGDVMERLTAFGFTDPTQKGRTLFTVQEADTLKRLIGNNINPANRSQTAALTQLGKSIDNAMMSGAESADTGALLKTAREAASQRFNTFKPRPLDAIVNGNIAPERWFDTQVLSKSTSAADLSRTLGTLDQMGAGGSVRSAAAKWLMDAAYSGDPERKAITGVGLDRAIKQIGERKLAVIYGREGLAKLKDIAAAAKDARFDVKDSAVNRSNTGSDLANMLLKVTGSPIFRMIDRGTLGMAGAAVNAGANNLAKTANEAAVRQAMAGSAGMSPQMAAALGLNQPRPNPLIRSLLPASLALPGTLDSRERTPR
ncbi:glucosaminidase domain-containing protein [Cupriavidus necator]|uniref:glucosaminidase domain-containing protein n=1 Tax=Cupriavidus necator TaxID=106590 RepID=UPI00339D5A32